jgi:hypothetical protein
MTKEIKIVRLSSGEELLCEYEQLTGTALLTNPVIIIPTAEGKITFMPYMSYAHATELRIENPNQFIMFIVDPVDEMKAKYLEVVDPSPIAKPSSKIII